MARLGFSRGNALSKTMFVFAVGMLPLAATGCFASAEKKPAKGRCTVNAQCPSGSRCEGTFCEDIYHPRSTIKNY